MGRKKNFKYYLIIFGIAVLAVLIYTVISWIGSGELDTQMLLSAFTFPLLFVPFLFVFDKVGEKLFSKRKKQQKSKDDFQTFVNSLNNAIDQQGNFSIQEYRTLQDSERFQKAIRQLFFIKNNGETKDLTFDYLGKKFKKSTVEYKAIQIIIDEVKKMD